VGGVHVYCPRCGTDLIECGKITKEEVLNEISHRNSPHSHPHFTENEHDTNVCVTCWEGVQGAGGTGGGDPDGWVSER